MSRTIRTKPTKSQYRQLALLAPPFGSGLRSTRMLDVFGTIWLTVEVKSTNDLGRELVAQYGWIALSYSIRRNGKVERTTFDPKPDDIVWAYSTTKYR